MKEPEHLPQHRNMLVTADLAKEWLNACNTHNRPISNTNVTYFMDTLHNDTFKLTHHGIAFSGPKPGTGTLVDGQNRLWAIYLTGISAWIDVACNVPLETQNAIDTGMGRTPRQAVSLAVGVNLPNSVTGGIRRLIFSLVPNTRRIDNGIFIKVYSQHREAIDFAVQHLRGKFGTSATVGCVTRAYYTVDRRKLEAFCEILGSGISDGSAGGAMVIKLRDEILESKIGFGSSAAVIAYARCERFLLAFIKNERLRSVYPTDRELFPLPEESKAYEASKGRAARAPHTLKTPRNSKSVIPTLAQLMPKRAGASRTNVAQRPATLEASENL